MRKRLPQVTLIAFGTTNLDGMAKSLEVSTLGIEFADAKLISSVPCNGIDEWNRNVVFRLHEFVDTSHALLIHPDGYVVHPESWKDEWLEYDYIGSPWALPTDSFSYRDINGKIQRVGNSVSLRSKKLMELPSKLNMEWKAFHGYTNEDGYICVNMRHLFEEHGCKFAPLEVAAEFGREVTLPEHKGKPFVFHRQTADNNYPIFE